MTERDERAPTGRDEPADSPPGDRNGSPAEAAGADGDTADGSSRPAGADEPEPETDTGVDAAAAAEGDTAGRGTAPGPTAAEPAEAEPAAAARPATQQAAPDRATDPLRPAGDRPADERARADQHEADRAAGGGPAEQAGERAGERAGDRAAVATPPLRISWEAGDLPSAADVGRGSGVAPDAAPPKAPEVARPAPDPGSEPEPEPEVDLAPPTGRVIPEPVRATGAITRGAIADAAKLVVLGRIRAALADVPTAERPHHVRVTRAYRTTGDGARADLVDRLIDRLTDYGAAVHRISPERLPRVILDACRSRDVKRLVVPGDLPVEWRPGYVEVLVDDPAAPLDLAAIDSADGVVTACALAIAETGTIVLDGGDWQGRRAITLVPDYHLCVVHVDQVVATVPEAVAALVEAADRPLTLISGPSATSDIELNRVQGVHGPRTLEVMLIG